MTILYNTAWLLFTTQNIVVNVSVSFLLIFLFLFYNLLVYKYFEIIDKTFCEAVIFVRYRHLFLILFQVIAYVISLNSLMLYRILKSQHQMGLNLKKIT